MRSSVSPLLTDLYQLNMVQAYLDHGMTDTAVFELFSRKMPPRRGFLMAAGLEQAVGYLLDGMAFGEDDLAWLERSGRFRPNFLDYLKDFRFTGDVHAMPEGTVFFADEPVLRITAPLPQAQLVETRLINILQVQSLVASKAARMVLAAPDRALVDFGLRRAHGSEAGLYAARAAYVAGFAGTATVPAEALFGVPLYGTMAHAFVQAHDAETAAFRNFAESRPDSVVLLVDTYDTEAGARKVADLAPELAERGIPLKGVRIDSGDLVAHAFRVREILDGAGLTDAGIFASGGLDEDELLRAYRAGAPIVGFGVGTSLTTSQDAPALDCAYKLQEYAGQARRKRSESKATWPGRKQVWRRHDPDGRMAGDTLTTADDGSPGGTPLLEQVVAGGERPAPAPDMETVRAHAARQLAALPESLRALGTDPVPVRVAPALRELAESVDAFVARAAEK